MNNNGENSVVILLEVYNCKGIYLYLTLINPLIIFDALTI